MKTAILVDAHFFLRRYAALHPGSHALSGNDIARALYAGSLRHIRKQKRGRDHLYRIFIYDCAPLTKRVQNPVSRAGITLAKTPEAIQRFEFHDALKKMRKVALRLGRYSDQQNWLLNADMLKLLLRGDAAVSDITPADVYLDIRQKGVDMKIGVDIASLAFKKQVDQIVLIAGDSDFVPAAKLARREGIDFLLDPMWNRINPDLHEHIDGLQSPWPRPDSSRKPVPAPPENG